MQDTPTPDATRFDTLPLDPAIQQALADKGFETMTPIQQRAIPILLRSTDFLGQAPTGTGKTVAFGLPMVQRLQPRQGHVQALVVCPTRELAQQTTLELNDLGKHKGITAIAIYGGENMFGQKDRLKKDPPDIIVGTPGRLLDHLRQVSLDFSRTRLVVLDEADEMLDMGFRDDMMDLLRHTPDGRETWLFSATISPEIRKIADRFMMYPEEVRIQPQVRTVDAITQYYLVTGEDNKPTLLRKLVTGTPDLYGIVFCHTKRDVVTLTRKLRERYPAECLHGAMEQRDRDTILGRFRRRELNLLVATDVLGRGIDIDNLTHVINYAPPSDADTYIHRIGRTARAGTTGTALTFFTPDQAYQLDQLQRKVGMTLERHPNSPMDFDPNATRSRRDHRPGTRPPSASSTRRPRRSGSRPKGSKGGNQAQGGQAPPANA